MPSPEGHPSCGDRARAALSGLWPILLALAIGTGGGLLFVWLRTPLPWMLGAMFACLAAAMVRAPVRRPEPLLAPMRVVLGVLVGSAFTPEIGRALSGMLISLAFVVPYVAVLGMIGVPYFRRIAGYDLTTAYFAAMPGGLPDMTAVGREMGGDEGKLALVHSTRVLIIVSLLPFVIESLEGLDLSGAVRFGTPLAEANLVDQVILLACGGVGWWGAARLGLTGASIVGPMLVSAAVHLAGFTSESPPDELIKLAQLVLGTGIGCSFIGVRPRAMLHAALLTLGLVVVMFVVTGVFAVIVQSLTNVSLISVLLAYVPGGQGEMNLIALSRGEDIAYVAVHHLVRVAVIVVGAPIVFRLLRPKPPPT